MSLKAPVVPSKTIGPSQEIEFTGIVLDSVRMEARLPQDKLSRIHDLLNSFESRRSVRLVELQTLIRTLQFACKVVVPGRTFLQRDINLTRGVPSRFHHIRLNKEVFKDLDMWKVFLANWNGHSFFLESFPAPTADLELYTDAAASIGFGGYLQGKWFQGHWPPTGRNRMFPYFWNVAETCSSMVLLHLRLAETCKFKSTWFCHVSGTEMPSHVSVIFKQAYFRCCSFPSCFCKRICSCLLHLPKHKHEMVLWTTMNLNSLTSRRRTTAAASGSTSPHTS